MSSVYIPAALRHQVEERERAITANIVKPKNSSSGYRWKSNILYQLMTAARQTRPIYVWPVHAVIVIKEPKLS